MKMTPEEQRERTNRIWDGDWEARVNDSIRSLGFSTVSDFCDAHPAVPFHKLASLIGEHVAAFQIKWLRYREAAECNTIRTAAADALVRELATELKRGWGHGVHRDFRRANAFSTWVVEVERIASRYKKQCESVWSNLIASSPPNDWVPLSPIDEYIVAAFDKGWPVESRQKIVRQSFGLLCPKCTAVLTSPPDDVNIISCPHCGESIELE